MGDDESMTAKTFLSAWVLAVFLAATPRAAAGDAEDTSRITDGLQAWLDGTRNLSAHFEQEFVSGALGGGQLDAGRVYIQRPGLMRWEYEEPEPMTALLLGQETWVYEPDLEQLTRSTLGEETGLLPSLLVGEGRLEEMFAASLPEVPAGAGKGRIALRLRPARDEETFEEVTLILRTRDFSIEVAEVVDGTGNRVKYTFSQLKRNRKLPAGVFDFEPPPGTRIVDDF